MPALLLLLPSLLQICGAAAPVLGAITGSIALIEDLKKLKDSPSGEKLIADVEAAFARHNINPLLVDLDQLVKALTGIRSDSKGGWVISRQWDTDERHRIDPATGEFIDPRPLPF
jgi:hypothetical protein